MQARNTSMRNSHASVLHYEANVSVAALQVCLYDLGSDESEHVNLADQHPDILVSLEHMNPHPHVNKSSARSPFSHARQFVWADEAHGSVQGTGG